jgi:acyl dehydratase
MPIASIEEIQTRIGSEIGASGWILVDQQAIDTFADVTGDRQFIHVDPEAAPGRRSAAPSRTASSPCRC